MITSSNVDHFLLTFIINKFRKDLKRLELKLLYHLRLKHIYKKLALAKLMSWTTDCHSNHSPQPDPVTFSETFDQLLLNQKLYNQAKSICFTTIHLQVHLQTDIYFFKQIGGERYA